MIYDEIKNNFKNYNEFVLPDYNGYNFANINNTLLNLFNVNYNGYKLDNKLYENLKGNNKIIFIYIDGLGYNHWINYLSNYKPFKTINENGMVSPITAVFPSTTAAASNTINTGLYPIEHGLFEWRLFIEKYNMVLKSLPFIPVYKEDKKRFNDINPDPEVLFNGKTFYETLKENGIKSYIISNSNLLKSDYSKIMYSGAKEKKRFDFLCEGFMILKKVIDKLKDNSYVFFYIENFDKMEHRYGPGSHEHLNSIKYISYLFDDLFKEIYGRDVSVIISSDHGFSKVDKKIYVNNIDKYLKEFNGKKIPETWSPRDMMLYLNDEDSAITYLKDMLNDSAEVMKTDYLLKNNLLGYGKLKEDYKSRLGNVLILPKNGNTVWYKYYENDIIKDNGMHGGLSSEEMVIPFSALNLKDIKNY